MHAAWLKSVTGQPTSYDQWLRDAISVYQDPISFWRCQGLTASLQLYLKSLTRSSPHESTWHDHAVFNYGGLLQVISHFAFATWNKSELAVVHNDMPTDNIMARTGFPFCCDINDSIDRPEPERVRLIEALSNKIADATALKSAWELQEKTTIDGPTSARLQFHSRREQRGGLVLYVAIVFSADIRETTEGTKTCRRQSVQNRDKLMPNSIS
jgi:hypothetical protein